MTVLKNVIIGKPVCEPWQMFCNTEDEWETEKNDVIFTEERNLAKILVQCGVVKSINEVRRNKPELMKQLTSLDFLEVKWGKSRLYVLVGL